MSTASPSNDSTSQVAGQVRNKRSDIDNVLPPVAELARDKATKLRYVDLGGDIQLVDYGEHTAADPYPIPMPVDREGYGSVDTSHQFWATGFGDLLNVKEAWARYGDDRPAKRLFDFGCATCRFLRHVSAFSEIEAHGCDFAPANVNWVKQHLPSKINVVLNTAEPKLPFPDDHFDIVTAFSVFTHIDELEEPWLLEMRRITRPNGILYLTIQNEATWGKVVDRPGSLKHLSTANNVPGNIHVSEELFAGRMPQDRIVFRMSVDDIYNCNVWFSDSYIKTTWSKHFQVLQIAENAHAGYQTPVIMRPL